VAASLATPSDTAIEALHVWTDGHPLGDAPSQVTAPTLMITTDDTFASRRLVSEQVAPRFEHCDIAHVPGAGHWSHVEQPAAVARMLTDFVNKSVTA
jgi:pimeloyl-ACP methyl ester carboxylesterase